MPPLVKRITSHTLVRYILIGGTSFVIEIGVLYLLIHYMTLPAVAAVAVSFWIGLIVSFVCQKYLAFQDNNTSKKRFLKQSVTYGLLIAINYFFTILFVSLCDDILGVYVARTAALIITTGWNYIIYAKIIFKKTS